MAPPSLRVTAVYESIQRRGRDSGFRPISAPNSAALNPLSRHRSTRFAHSTRHTRARPSSLMPESHVVRPCVSGTRETERILFPEPRTSRFLPKYQEFRYILGSQFRRYLHFPSDPLLDLASKHLRTTEAHWPPLLIVQTLRSEENTTNGVRPSQGTEPMERAGVLLRDQLRFDPG